MDNLFGQLTIYDTVYHGPVAIWWISHKPNRILGCDFTRNTMFQ